MVDELSEIISIAMGNVKGADFESSAMKILASCAKNTCEQALDAKHYTYKNRFARAERTSCVANIIREMAKEESNEVYASALMEFANQFQMKMDIISSMIPEE